MTKTHADSSGRARLARGAFPPHVASSRVEGRVYIDWVMRDTRRLINTAQQQQHVFQAIRGV